MPSRTSSQAVSRAPCRNGRVSSAKTATLLPCSTAARIDAERRAVAGRRQRAGVAVRQDARAVGHDVGAERAHRPAARDVLVVNRARLALERGRQSRRPTRRPAPPSANARFMRSIAQNRLTAVGRVPAIRSQSLLELDGELPGALAPCCASCPSAMPIAAATPIAGAPRITIVLIARATSGAVLQRT